MRTKAAVVIVSVLVALGWASPASAKGMASGTIEGEGIATPIDIFSSRLSGAENLVNETGIYQTIWPMDPPGAAVSEAPTTELGPRFTIRWGLMGANGDMEVLQDLYPYAEGGPVTHTAPGQRLDSENQTVGGWFRGPQRLVERLHALGVPTLDELTTGDRAGRAPDWTPIGASLVAMLLLGVGFAVLARRRGGVAPAVG